MDTSRFKLVIGNKNYSSWSFRPWIAMTYFEVPFEEILELFDDEMENPHFLKYSPTKKVPVLQDGDFAVWDSLAILEYLADCLPEKNFWPQETQARARARSISAEMHAGFADLRNQCPMNMRREVRSIPISEATKRDVARIEAMWQDCLEISGGPFLFGKFSNADAMYAPVVNRLEVYALSDAPAVLRYREAMKGSRAWQAWEAAGRAEPWIVEHDEA